MTEEESFYETIKIVIPYQYHFLTKKKRGTRNSDTAIRVNISKINRSHGKDQLVAVFIPGNDYIPQGHNQGYQDQGRPIPHGIRQVKVFA